MTEYPFGPRYSTSIAHSSSSSSTRSKLCRGGSVIPDFRSAVEDAAAVGAAIAREAVRHMGRIRIRIYTEINWTDAQERHLDAARNRMCESLPVDLAQRADPGV